MSLFGGDSGPPSPSQASDFSISTIADERETTARSEASLDAEYNVDDDEQADGGAGGVVEEQNDDSRNTRSPSAMSDTSDAVIRPNRFRGSDRAWLHHTQSERSLAHSLDQLRAQELSLHLYSAHHLKARLRDPATHASLKPWSRKSRWLSTNQSWYPESSWTAWPLHAANIPSGTETFGQTKDGLDAFTLAAAAQPTPAENLRQQLYAVMLARANQSWKARNTPLLKPAQSRPDPPSRPDSHSTARRRSRSLSAALSIPPSSPAAHLSSLASFDQPPTSSSPAHDLPLNHISEVKNEAPEPTDDKTATLPVFSADDDRSNDLLHPTVSHIMTKLDKLLLALHQSRQAHAYRARDTADTSDSSARSNSRSRSTSNKPSKPQAAKLPTRQSRRISKSASRQTTPMDGVVFDDSGEDETYEPEEESKRRAPSTSTRGSPSDSDDQVISPSGKKRRSTRKLGLRDWSELLGMATLSGWDPAAIQNARQRCSSLFGEDMHLYTMAEHADSSADEAEPARQPSKLSNQKATWPCPLVNCFRHMQPFDQGFRWREHMRKSHKYEKNQVEKLEQQMVQSGDIALTAKRHHVLAHNPRGWQPPDPLRCEHCTNSAFVFPKVARLLDHMRRTHKYDPRIRGPPKDQEEDDVSEEPSSADEDDDYMVGGVHNDGFLQPVLRIAGARGKDLKQRAKRAKERRSKAELRNAKRQKVVSDQEPSPSIRLEDTDMEG